MARKTPALAFAALLAAGCIHRAPEPVVHPDSPHISWEIASDSLTHSSEKHACTSVARTPCELPLGTAEKPLDGEFTIYLHPAVEETTYTGVVEIGYLGIDATKPARLDVNQKVPPRRVSNVPIQANISSRLVAQPGSYRVSMKIVATTGGKSTTIEDAVTVTIGRPAKNFLQAVDTAVRIVNVLVISGSMGSGKTTLMGEISDLLTAGDICHAAIELDTLALGHLPAGAEHLQSANLAAMWQRFAALGVSRLLVSGAIESHARQDEIRGSVPGSRLTVCRLRARLETMERRVRLREPGMLQEQFVARVQPLEAALDAAGLEDFSVDNDGRSVTDVAREVLRLAKWM